MTQHLQEVPVVSATDSPLENINDLFGDKLTALDGDIGYISDFYFDDNIWVIRYAVADTGSWLTGRLVLLSPYAFGKLDHDQATLHINLRKMQIQNSPPIEPNKPISRLSEVEYYRYYGWPAYWSGDGMWGKGGYPVLVPPERNEIGSQNLYYHRDDMHLRSARDVTGYSIQATDGIIGRVSGFLVDDRSWAIRELLVEAGHWYSEKEIRITTNKVDWISHKDLKVHVSLNKADIQATAEHGLAHSGAERHETTNLHV
jgi:hypothetical protein